jgi:hypothetical protein
VAADDKGGAGKGRDSEWERRLAAKVGAVGPRLPIRGPFGSENATGVHFLQGLSAQHSQGQARYGYECRTTVGASGAGVGAVGGGSWVRREVVAAK